MNKEDLVTLLDKVISKLQKRDEILLDRENKITIKSWIFSEYEIAYYIADIYSKQHSIPKKYLKYYIKTTDNNRRPKITITNKGRQILKSEFVHIVISKRLLAGGSLAKTFLGEDKNNKTIVIKSASGWSSKKLANEIIYLRELGKYNEVSLHIPKIIDSDISENDTSLTLKYYPYNTLSYHILFSKNNTEEIWRTTKKVLDFVSKNIWTKKNQITPDNYIETFFLDRIVNNAEKMATQSVLLSKITDKKTVTINGHRYINLLGIVKQIRNNESLQKRLRPPYLQTIWGDLHPNNILIHSDKFILIDPRGDMGDYLYDLGKIYHTYGPGRYDYIDNDLFSVKVTIDTDINIKRRFFIEHPSWKSYNKLRVLFEKDIYKYINKSDENWKLRWEFLKFCIYATMPLFLIKNDGVESRALMGYSNAVIFGNRFLKYLNDHGK